MNKLRLLLQDQNIKFFSLGLIILAAWFATGYHHPDEFMQIIEFANVKLGGRSAQDLPWEYHETMRSWFQPGLFYILASCFKFVGISSPFLIWSVFRLSLGILFWFALQGFVKTGSQFLNSNEARRIFILASYLLFFIPWLATRASSESLSATFMMLSSSIILGRSKNDWFIWGGAGLISGLAFLSRFQSAFLILGLVLWLIIIKKENLKNLILYFAGAAIAIAFGVLIDSWGYERFTFSAYHYFYQNIVLNKAAQWGVKPFWYYIVLMQNHGMPIHSIVITIAFIYSVFRFRKNPYVWMTVPFILIHSVVGHKEMRFLFPVATFSSLFLALAWKRVFHTKIIYNFLLGTNFFALIFMSIWPSRTEVLIQKVLFARSPAVLVVNGKNPYSLGDFPVYYTKPQSMQVVVVRDVNEFLEMKKNLATSSLAYVTTKFDSIEFRDVENSNCKKEWQAFPDWVGGILPLKVIESAGNYTLFICH